jgi:tRNA1Val (adenine37-N6)-methyltransferase
VSGTTVDALGPLLLEQPARGYRFNQDAPLLAEFTGACRGTLFDLGAGVGAIGLSMLMGGAATNAVLVERDFATAQLLASNVARNELSRRATVLAQDALVAARAHRGEASVVVCNPPYVRPGAGRAPADKKRDARMGDVDVFIAATRALLGKRGRACFVYPANDFGPLLADFRAQGLEPKRVRFVHASARANARVVLVEVLAAKPGGLVVMPPLVEG